VGLASYLRIEERELEAGSVNYIRSGSVPNNPSVGTNE
jgi:hypothetical protein